MEEAFAAQALHTYQTMQWVEPIWKMLLSNKGLLPILWELYPGHDLLVEAHRVKAEIELLNKMHLPA